MKRNLLILLLLISFTSCEEFLTEEPKSLLSPSNFPSSAQDANLMLGGMMQRLDDYYQRDFYLSVEITSDEAEVRYNSGDRYDMDYFTYTTGNQYFRDVWGDSYEIISEANFMIAAIPEESEWGAPYIAAAKFYRAFHYFHLTRLWGKVPLRLEPVETFNQAKDATKASEEEIYTQILEDLAYAESNLPDFWTGGNDDGRPTLGAAKTLMAKVYLTMAGWPLKQTDKYALAAQKAGEVVNSGNYALLNNFADVFKIANENSSEHIWSVQYSDPSSGGTMMTVQSRPSGGGIKDGGWYFWNTSEQFMSKFEDIDTRKAGTFLTDLVEVVNGDTVITNYTSFSGGNELGAKPCMQKWQDYGSGRQFTDEARRTGLNFPIFRLSEAYLILAEAENEANGPTQVALNALNTVRERANLEAVGSVGQGELRDIIRNEWSLELAHEAKRRFNLVRWELFDQTMANDIHAAANYQPHMKLLPVPQNEVDVSGLAQNDGY
ncbi:RagB/SusD family nutrient uptake outer membrane protein [Flexithrix dorotheae]|uniref:RagB/SusD family nutrient uptake outer membrane protein n=1 Tax=Flexithrix dorotheae TaxID=70993 RepID=UPI0003682660|nr:RagB/SusD family nutrient uptake outer membrane protein [Flexithrix dorotheae]